MFERRGAPSWLLFVASGLLIASAPSAVAAGAGQQVSVAVAPGSQVAAQGGWYRLDLAAGTSATQRLRLTNPTDQALPVVVKPVDAYTSSATGVAYSSVDDQVSGTGLWVSVATPELTLTPHEQRDVEFTVDVPSGVGSGQHLAGIAAYTPVGAADGNGGPIAITLQPQRVIGVEVDVPGPASPLLTVTGARAVAADDGVDLALGMANDGTAFATGTGTVSVSSTGLRTTFPINTFLPGDSIELKVPWMSDPVPGVHPIDVRLVDGTGRVVSWQGTVELTGGATAQLAAQVAEQRDLLGGTRTASLTPWFIAGAGIVLAAIGAAAIRNRRSSLAVR